MKTTILAACLAVFAPAALAGLPTGLSGTWYNPAQSGHGVLLEMLSPDRAIGAWNVFDTAGNPMHLYLEGQVVGDELVLQAYAPRGMKFGSFDRSAYSAPRWGSLTVEFSDCDNAMLTYAADGAAGAGFGNGAIPITRLTRIGGSTCELASPSNDDVVLRAGVYEGLWERALPDFGDVRALHAAVDRAGRFWATSALTPGPTYVRATVHPPVLFSDAPAVGQRQGIGLHARFNSAVQRGTGSAPPPGALDLTLDYRVTSNGVALITAASGGQPKLLTRLEAEHLSAADPLDADGFSIASLAGKRFRFIAVGQFFEVERTIEFRPDGSLCILHDGFPPMLCEFEGIVRAQDAGMAMFDFTLKHSFDPGAAYVGKGWLRRDTGELVLVAASGEKGLGVVATPAP